MNPLKVSFHTVGRWHPLDVVVHWVPEERPRHPDIEKAIEDAWQNARYRGLKLIDGPMCRLENFTDGPRLKLNLSRTSYKIFWGTNLQNASFADEHGRESLANPLGLSCALESADNYLLLGRRNASVGYYPKRIHPFAGTLEPADPLDIFGEMRRELCEELALEKSDLDDLQCIALMHDVSIAQPELIFSAKSNLTRAEIEKKLDPAEHDGLVAIQPDVKIVNSALKNPDFTPVALGTILLWGRDRLGNQWFDAAEPMVNLGES
jgi:hypothetical protein